MIHVYAWIQIGEVAYIIHLIVHKPLRIVMYFNSIILLVVVVSDWTISGWVVVGDTDVPVASSQ